jgi:fluoroquinolone transport system ATP-binding protein
MKEMTSITLACPRCKQTLTVQGTPGEKNKVVCPYCGTKGVFTIPEDQIRHQSIEATTILDIQNLQFIYPAAEKKAIDAISFQIHEGEIFGFLGPNGAGKTTTQKLIMGLLKGYQGSITVFGKNLQDWGTAYYEKIGVCFESPNHYQKLTAYENLDLFSSFYTTKTIDPHTLLGMVGLEADANHRVATFSKGMKTKLNFVRALLNNPQLLFLDEPTTGLDPVSARQVKDIILQQKKAGKSIFLTTHNMTDADELCDRVGFLVDGTLQLVEKPRNLKIGYGKKTVKVEYLKEGQLLREEFTLADLGRNSTFLTRLNEESVQTIHTQEASLEDIFIQVTGRQLQ